MRRGTSPVLGVVLLCALTVVTAATVGAAVWPSLPDRPPVADFDLDVDADANQLTLRHVGGEALAVTDISLRVHVSGEPLTHQPPVPYFATDGFRSGPTGPLNVGADGPWRAGQSATIRLASTNHPLPHAGDRVTVRVVTDRAVVAELTATAT